MTRMVAALGTSLLWASLAPATVHAGASRTADVGIAMSGPSQIEQGSHAQYTVTYTNKGPQTATNTYVVVTLDPSLYWDPFDTTGSCTNRTPPGAVTQYTFVCVVGTVPAGSAGSFEFAIQAPSSTSTGTYEATFSIAADAADNNQENNTAVDHITVVTPQHADVWTDIVRDYGNTNPYSPGETIWVDAQYGNDGPAVATDEVETFALPASFTFDPGNSDSRCSATGQTVTCPLGTIPVTYGANDVVIAFEATTSGAYDVTANINSDQPDPDTTNNTSTDTIDVS